jgi:hypothetical protein
MLGARVPVRRVEQAGLSFRHCRWPQVAAGHGGDPVARCSGAVRARRGRQPVVQRGVGDHGAAEVAGEIDGRLRSADAAHVKACELHEPAGTRLRGVSAPRILNRSPDADAGYAFLEVSAGLGGRRVNQMST